MLFTFCVLLQLVLSLSLSSEHEACLHQFKLQYDLLKTSEAKCLHALSRAMPCFDTRLEKQEFLETWDDGRCNVYTSFIYHDETETISEKRRRRQQWQATKSSRDLTELGSLKFTESNASRTFCLFKDPQVHPLDLASIYEYSAQKFKGTPFGDAAKLKAVYYRGLDIEEKRVNSSSEAELDSSPLSVVPGLGQRCAISALKIGPSFVGLAVFLVWPLV